jgi:hypothetical protein
MILLTQPVPGFDTPGAQRGICVDQFRPGRMVSARSSSRSRLRRRLGPHAARRAPKRSSAAVTNEISADLPPSTGRYSSPSGQVRRVSCAPNTPVSITTAPRTARRHASRIASTKMRSSSSVRSSISISSCGGRGRAAASTSSLLLPCCVPGSCPWMQALGALAPTLRTSRRWTGYPLDTLPSGAAGGFTERRGPYQLQVSDLGESALSGPAVGLLFRHGCADGPHLGPGDGARSIVSPRPRAC